MMNKYMKKFMTTTHYANANYENNNIPLKWPYIVSGNVNLQPLLKTV